MATVYYDGVATKSDDNLDDLTWYMGHTSMSKFHMEW